jgi:hypothetical protein
MGFVERALTPPGTGGREAAQIQANTDIAAAKAKAAAAPPSLPSISAAPPAPPTFSPGQSPGAKQAARTTATSMLGAAATAGQSTKKSLLGQ